MKSHSYQSGDTIWRVMLIPGVMVLLFAAAMFGMERSGRFTPWPLLDLDRTILTHQINLATRAPPAQIVWLGDSSCLMDIDATRHSGMINLGTISHLGLKHHARLLDRYLHHTKETPRLVVVFIHPDSVRRERDTQTAGQQFDVLMSAHVSPSQRTASYAFGLDAFRDRILARVLPIPLSGAYGRDYGYTQTVFHQMTQNRGGLIAAGRYDPNIDTGSNEMWLGKKAMNDTIAFRAAWPEGIQLAIGFAPAPDSFASSNHAAQAVALLHEWNQYMQADVVLDHLPLVLPDALFADRRHLNGAGRAVFAASIQEVINRDAAR